MSVVGIPVMTKKSFMDTERAIGEVWKQELLESMADAGREVKQLAVARGDFHEGVPAITGCRWWLEQAFAQALLQC